MIFVQPRTGPFAALLFLSFFLTVGALAAEGGEEHAHCQAKIQAAQQYSREEVQCVPPEVILIDQNGRKTSLPQMLAEPGPVMVQFIFTTCPTICPVLSSTFKAVQDRTLNGQRYRLISITIDPEYDTPERLNAYARDLGAGPSWTFLTGSMRDIIKVQQAFGVYRGNKMRHEPITFLRQRSQGSWLQLNGFMGAEELAGEMQKGTP